MGAIFRLRSAPRCPKETPHTEGKSPAPWPINKLHISVPRCTKNKFSAEETSLVPWPINGCHISVPIGAEVYKKTPHNEGKSPAPWPINRLHISVPWCTKKHFQWRKNPRC